VVIVPGQHGADEASSRVKRPHSAGSAGSCWSFRCVTAQERHKASMGVCWRGIASVRAGGVDGDL